MNAPSPRAASPLFVASLVAALALAGLGCGKSPPEKGAESPAKETTSTSSVGTVGGAAKVGEAAPDFDLKDLDGKSVKLSDYKGKTVVLEWFNPGCPFVRNAHTKGPLVAAAQKAMDKGVVWLAINSGAPGNQGAGVAANVEGKKTYNLSHPILLDDSGAVGHKYGATNTPHIMIVDAKGVLVYRGSADNSPDGEGLSPENGKLVSYVDETLTALAAGKPVTTSETKAYGCSVKYASH
ncbi:MAG: redoxin family protein [Polyangiaceae bacterium]|nr:redoxin family protein [Polyangiaceae bacterium]